MRLKGDFDAIAEVFGEHVSEAFDAQSDQIIDLIGYLYDHPDLDKQRYGRLKTKALEALADLRLNCRLLAVRIIEEGDKN